MSWNVDYYAENKAGARNYLDHDPAGKGVPQVVKEAVFAGLDGLNDDGLVRVRTHGHIATNDSAQKTAIEVTVERLHITAGAL